MASYFFSDSVREQPSLIMIFCKQAIGRSPLDSNQPRSLMWLKWGYRFTVEGGGGIYNKNIKNYIFILASNGE
jgi:hypothetical protein